MKKIRLLALLLALLMIPFGLLFACNDDEDEDEENENEEENEGDDEEEENQGGSTNVAENKRVNDGTKSGYLAFFSFDNADNGNLGVIAPPTSSTDVNYAAYSDLKPIEPYFSHLSGSIVSGGAYTVRTLSATDKYLSIQRTGGNVTAPQLDFNVGTSSVATDLGATHILQFDMDFTDGLFGSTVTVSGVKASVTQTLFSIEDNVMYDCNGDAIYGEKATDKKGWISIAIVINDTSRTYDIYIDMVKQTNGLAYSNSAYKSWNQDQLSGYRFAISANSSNDVYVRIDDLAIRNGREKDLGTLAGSDILVKYYDTASFKYSYLEPTRDGVVRFIATQAGVKDLKTEMFGTGALASDRITLSKVNTVTGEITDVYHDYGALKGDYSEILTLRSGNTEIKLTTYNGSITYDADTSDDTDAISGTYTYADGVLTFGWGENAAPQIEGADIVAGKYADGVLSVYSDAGCTTKLAELELDRVEDNNVLAENEIYAVKFTNISKIADNGETVMKFDNIWYKNNAANLSDFKISFYATQDMVDRNVQFMIRFLCEKIPAPTVDDPDKTMIPYAGFVFKPGAESAEDGSNLTYTAGFNTYSLSADDMLAIANDKTLFALSSSISVRFSYWGWSNNAYSVNNYQIYFTELGFDFSNVKVEVEGPDASNAKCEHVNAYDEDAFEPIDGMIERNCAYGSYYLLQCTECGATKIDTNRPTGYIDHHVFDSVTHTEYATCYKNGRVYRVCTVCGQEDTVETLASSGHQNVVVSIIGKNVTQMCKICGLDNSFIVRDELMTFQHKMNELGFLDSDKNNWSTNQEGNENIYIDTYYGSFASWFTTVTKTDNKDGMTWQTVDTDYGSMLLMKSGTKSYETYFTVVPVGNAVPFFKATNFVIEFDYMLGEPGDNGRYNTVGLSISWRNGPISTAASYGALKLQSDGSVQLSSYVGQANKTDYTDNPAYKLEKNKVYNLACHVNLSTNRLSLYINGVFWDDCQFLANVADSSTFSPTEYRFGCYGDRDTGCEQYFNNFLHYEAAKEPICVLTGDIAGGSDFEGDVPLQDELLNTMKNEFDVADNGYDVKVRVPASLYLKQYVFEYTINAQNALADGTLLVANKNGNGYDRSLDLVTVKDGKLYVMGVLVSETTNVKLSLAFDDNTNSLVVYVNNQRIAGTITFEGEFTDSSAIIRSFTLLNDCGSYGVSGLKMYTGTEVK